MINRSHALLLCVLLATTTGCGPFFHGVSTPPPTRTATLDRGNDHIEVSQGVALAFECRDVGGVPCEKASAKSQDERIAKVLPAYLDRTSEGEHWGGPRHHWSGPQPRTAFVVYGIAPGTTKLNVHYGGNDQAELTVTVLPDPALADATQ